jgi:hypothetical protein
MKIGFASSTKHCMGFVKLLELDTRKSIIPLNI